MRYHDVFFFIGGKIVYSVVVPSSERNNSSSFATAFFRFFFLHFFFFSGSFPQLLRLRSYFFFLFPLPSHLSRLSRRGGGNASSGSGGCGGRSRRLDLLLRAAELRVRHHGSRRQRVLLQLERHRARTRPPPVRLHRPRSLLVLLRRQHRRVLLLPPRQRPPGRRRQPQLRLRPPRQQLGCALKRGRAHARQRQRRRGDGAGVAPRVDGAAEGGRGQALDHAVELLREAGGALRNELPEAGRHVDRDVFRVVRLEAVVEAADEVLAAGHAGHVGVDDVREDRRLRARREPLRAVAVGREVLARREDDGRLRVDGAEGAELRRQVVVVRRLQQRPGEDTRVGRVGGHPALHGGRVVDGAHVQRGGAGVVAAQVVDRAEAQLVLEVVRRAERRLVRQRRVRRLLPLALHLLHLPDVPLHRHRVHVREVTKETLHRLVRRLDGQPQRGRHVRTQLHQHLLGGARRIPVELRRVRRVVHDGAVRPVGEEEGGADADVRLLCVAGAEGGALGAAQL
eukprot:Rhum_TRINITY_DN14207_c3_g2::Rhum_TRINITY_DN14207_c3_g2_i1::g.73555::m.73555